MPDKIRGSERTERSREISAIKKRPQSRPRSSATRALGLPDREGLTQRELAMLVGTSQGPSRPRTHEPGCLSEDPPPFVRSVEGGARRPLLCAEAAEER